MTSWDHGVQPPGKAGSWQITQGRSIQVSDDLQRKRLHSISEQLVPVLCHFTLIVKKGFFVFVWNILCFSFLLVLDTYFAIKLILFQQRVLLCPFLESGYPSCTEYTYYSRLWNICEIRPLFELWINMYAGCEQYNVNLHPNTSN